MARVLVWQRGARGGNVAAVRFVSEDARGLRLGLLVRRLPAEAVVRGYGRGGPALFEVPGKTILEVIKANRDAGDLGDAGRTWWTPLVDGAELTLEIEVPRGVLPEAVEIAVPTLSHLW